MTLSPSSGEKNRGGKLAIHVVPSPASGFLDVICFFAIEEAFRRSSGSG
jgi:hypothetical protein